MTVSYRGLPIGADSRALAEWANRVQTGKINVAFDVTITPNSATTTLTDARIGAESVLLFMPMTASAATEQAAGSMWVSATGDGTATLQNSNSATSDRTFRVLVMR